MLQQILSCVLSSNSSSVGKVFVHQSKPNERVGLPPPPYYALWLAEQNKIDAENSVVLERSFKKILCCHRFSRVPISGL